jgi:hypothetical protein
MAKTLVACICALLLIAQVQLPTLAAGLKCYQMEQTHRSLGNLTTCFDADSVRIDWPATHIVIFAKAPDWSVKVFNFKTKQQASETFDGFCKSGFRTYTIWAEMDNLEGHYQKKTPIDFNGFKAYELVCVQSEEHTDPKKDGISWSFKRKMVPLEMRYVFLDGVKVDSHIARILAAIYLVAWEDRLLLAVQRRALGTPTAYMSLKTSSIKSVPYDKENFSQPSGFQSVPIGHIGQGKLEYFN